VLFGQDEEFLDKSQSSLDWPGFRRHQCVDDKATDGLPTNRPRLDPDPRDLRRRRAYISCYPSQREFQEVNKNQIRVLFGAGLCFVFLVALHLPREGPLAVFDAVGYSAGTSPIWFPIVVLLLFLFRTKKQKQSPQDH